MFIRIILQKMLQYYTQHYYVLKNQISLRLKKICFLKMFLNNNNPPAPKKILSKLDLPININFRDEVDYSAAPQLFPQHISYSI